jgi:transposase InsO family protein
VRGTEALDLIKAWGSGHPGDIGTIHAGTGLGVLRRLEQVKASFRVSDRTYGARRVWPDLLAECIDCGLYRVEWLMRLPALRARPRRRRLPKDDGDRQVANVPLNLLDRQFVAAQPN